MSTVMGMVALGGCGDGGAAGGGRKANNTKNCDGWRLSRRWGCY